MTKTDVGVIVSPTQQYKMDILRLLNKIEDLDIKLEKRGYVNGVKHLQWKMIKYIPKTIRRKISDLEVELVQEKKKIESYDLTSEQKQKKKLELDYEYYNLICQYITKILSFSPIIEEEVTGILEVGEDVEELEKMNEVIKTTKKEQLLLVDHGEAEEGSEPVTDGS